MQTEFSSTHNSVCYFVTTTTLKRIFKCDFQSFEQARRRAKDWMRQMSDNGKHENLMVYKCSTVVYKDHHLHLHRTIEDTPVWEGFWYIADNGDLEIDERKIENIKQGSVF